MEGAEGAPRKIRVHGRKGPNQKLLNGIYCLQNKTHEGHVLYQKMSDEKDPMVFWHWAKKHVWMIARKSMINSDSAYACIQDPAEYPHLVKGHWKVFAKKAQTHMEDEFMKVVPVPEAFVEGDSREISDLTREKAILQDNIERMKRRIDSMEEQVREVDSVLYSFSQDKVEALSFNSFFQESILKIKLQDSQMRRQMTNEIQKSKELRSLHKELKLATSVKSKNSSFQELEALASSDDCDDDTLLECIFSVFEEEGFEESMKKYISPSTLICNEFLKEVGLSPVTLTPIESPALSPVQTTKTISRISLDECTE